jgi:hypothetical protein
VVSQIFEDVLASGGRAHVFFEGLVNALKLGCFFSQLAFDVPRSEDVFKVDPVLLDDEPIIDDEHAVVYSFLQIFGLRSLALEVSVAEDAAEVG